MFYRSNTYTFFQPTPRPYHMNNRFLSSIILHFFYNFYIRNENISNENPAENPTHS